MIAFVWQMPADGTGTFFLVRLAIQFSVRAAYRLATIGHVASGNDLSVTFGDLVMLQKASERAEATHAKWLQPLGARLRCIRLVKPSETVW